MSEKKGKKAAQKQKKASEEARKEMPLTKAMGLGTSDEYSRLTEHREDEIKKNLITRLSRMEGQIKGVRTMVENDRYTVDLLVQGISLIAALKSFCRMVMEDHFAHEVAEDLKNGSPEGKAEEFLDMLQKIMG